MKNSWASMKDLKETRTYKGTDLLSPAFRPLFFYMEGTNMQMARFATGRAGMGLYEVSMCNMYFPKYSVIVNTLIALDLFTIGVFIARLIISKGV